MLITVLDEGSAKESHAAIRGFGLNSSLPPTPPQNPRFPESARETRDQSWSAENLLGEAARIGQSTLAE
jgi:hypothetical protein